MRSINNFILKIEKPLRENLVYKSLELYTPEVVNIHNEWDYMNNWGEVIAVPENKNVECEVGDTVYVHHNIVINNKNSLNAQNIQSNQFAIDESLGLYNVPYEEVGRNNLAYVRVDKEGNIHTLGDVLLCVPFKECEEHITDGGLLLKENYARRGLRLTCEVAYSNKLSESKGIKSGSIVTLADNSDYSITIDGVEYWRIFDSDIYHYGDDHTKPYGDDVCVKLDEFKNETESGLIISTRSNKRSNNATVVAIGNHESELSVGDSVIIENLSRMEIIDSADMVFYTKESNIYGVIG